MDEVGPAAGRGSARATASGEPLTRRQILIVFSGLLLAILLAALDSTIVATALPTIVGELGGAVRGLRGRRGGGVRRRRHGGGSRSGSRAVYWTGPTFPSDP
jgi:hypothetical protein